MSQWSVRNPDNPQGLAGALIPHRSLEEIEWELEVRAGASWYPASLPPEASPAFAHGWYGEEKRALVEPRNE